MIPISDIMTCDVKCVTPEVPIYEALERLKKYCVSGLPVVDSTMRIVGILSEKDVLKILFDPKPVVQYTVEHYMTREVICFTEFDDAVEICKFFIRTNIRRVPIVRDGILIGIVARRDIISAILEARSKLSDYRYV